MRWASSALAAKMANSLLGCIRRCRASILRKGIIRFCSALLRPQLEHCPQFWVPQHKTDTDKLKEVQHRATVMTGGWSTHSVGRHWGGKDWFSLEQRWPHAGKAAAPLHLEVDTKAESSSSQSCIFIGRTRRNRHWLNQERFWLLIRKNLCKYKEHF